MDRSRQGGRRCPLPSTPNTGSCYLARSKRRPKLQWGYRASQSTLTSLRRQAGEGSMDVPSGSRPMSIIWTPPRLAVRDSSSPLPLAYSITALSSPCRLLAFLSLLAFSQNRLTSHSHHTHLLYMYLYTFRALRRPLAPAAIYELAPIIRTPSCAAGSSLSNRAP